MNMQRFAPYLAVIAALALALFVLASLGRSTVVVTPVATSTLSVLPSPIAIETLTPETETVATSAPEAPAPTKVAQPKPAPAPAPASSAPVAAPVPATAPPLPSGNEALDAAAAVLRAALVNIICYVPLNSGLHSISGSGVFIDSKGIILTNAHIAQYFLLADRGAACTIRSGSPATDSYKAALIYISPAWLAKNPTVLSQDNPSGTGEADFALLAVTNSVTSATIPATFPFLPLATRPPPPNTPVVIASYGAQFLGQGQIQSGLFPTIVFGSVKDVFTFATTTIDVLALGGSAAAQEGSSGGGVAGGDGKLIGTITTSTVSGSTDTRSLDAITASYIRAEYASETGEALDLFLAESTASSVNHFAPKIPALEALITAQLPQ